MRPELILKDKTGIAIDTAGDVTVTDAAQWKVKYTPDAGDFNAGRSPYTARFKITDGQGQIVFFPSIRDSPSFKAILCLPMTMRRANAWPATVLMF